MACIVSRRRTGEVPNTGAEGGRGDLGPWIVRAYAPGDRSAVRRLALACADPRIFPACLAKHGEWMADLLTRYSTDFEPGMSFVAVDSRGAVIGYALGCQSTARRNRTMLLRILPRIVLRALFSGVLFSCPWVSLAAGGMRSWRAGRRSEGALRGLALAHFHVGVAEGARGRGVGRALLERFEAEAGRSGGSGIRASVLAPNPTGQAFFARNGFLELAQMDAYLPGRRSPVRVILLGKSIGVSASEHAEEESTA